MSILLKSFEPMLGSGEISVLENEIDTDTCNPKDDLKLVGIVSSEDEKVEEKKVDNKKNFQEINIKSKRHSIKSKKLIQKSQIRS